MSTQWPARAAFARATGTLIALAVAVGLTTGGAYLVGGLARASMVHSQMERLALSASSGFSEPALQGAVKEPGALAIAREHDPYTPAGTEQADHEDRVAAFSEALDARRAAGAAQANLRLSEAESVNAVAPPRSIRLRGALDQSRDLECLTQAVYYEARGEGAEGEAAVAQVVLNRTHHPAFPKTVCGVVFQGASDGGCQFSFACDGSVRHHVESAAWRRAQTVAQRALHGFVMAEVGSATHFHVAALSPGWGPHLLKVAQVGAHVFYRFGARGAQAPTAASSAHPTEAAPAQPVYASLSLAPLASSVASTVANSVVDAAAAGAELVMAATAPKALAAAHPATPEAAAPHAPPVEPAKPAAAATAPASSASPPAAAPAAAATTASAAPAKSADAVAKPAAS